MPNFPEEWSKRSVVLCHDWLTGMRGGERVLETLCLGFPNAPIFTLFHNPKAVSPIINRHRIWTSWLQPVPGVTRYYRYLLPLFPSAIELMDAPPAELLISTSHCVAKGLKPKPGMKHLCYCFTPMRYAWLFYDEYFGKSAVKAALAKVLLPVLRKWDFTSSRRVDRFVAISRHVQQRIQDFYQRDADVVYPPVDTERWTPGQNVRSGDFDLIVSALVPYKRVDLAVEAYNQLGTPLKIAGTGSEAPKLRRMAGPNIEFLGWQPDEDLLKLYRSSRLLVFPGEEDFGIVPLEAQSCGKPVVAYGRGGLLETVQEGVSGVFFKEQTVEAIKAAVRTCAAVRWEARAIRAHAEKFNTQNFIDGLNASIRSCLTS
jgi:glycosyltransferase involved in cell wall biosynthesis